MVYQESSYYKYNYIIHIMKWLEFKVNKKYINIKKDENYIDNKNKE
jgi:hypothetical protein